MRWLKHVRFRVGPVDLLPWATLVFTGGWKLRAFCILCLSENWGIAVIQRVRKEENDE
jgi:hypothetical protein